MVPNEDEVRDLTLLIRAGSTILSRLCPKVAPAASCRSNHYKYPLAHADRLAVLFVPKEEDVAAVSYAHNAYGINVHALWMGGSRSKNRNWQMSTSVRSTKRLI